MLRRRKIYVKTITKKCYFKKGKAETTTASGIILTSPQKQAGNQAIVVAVGSKCDEDLKEGMKVIFKEYSGTKFEDHDDEYIILEEKDIIAIIE